MSLCHCIVEIGAVSPVRRPAPNCPLRFKHFNARLKGCEVSSDAMEPLYDSNPLGCRHPCALAWIFRETQCDTVLD